MRIVTGGVLAMRILMLGPMAISLTTGAIIPAVTINRTAVTQIWAVMMERQATTGATETNSISNRADQNRRVGINGVTPDMSQEYSLNRVSYRSRRRHSPNPICRRRRWVVRSRFRNKGSGGGVVGRTQTGKISNAKTGSLAPTNHSHSSNGRVDMNSGRAGMSNEIRTPANRSQRPVLLQNGGVAHAGRAD